MVAATVGAARIGPNAIIQTVGALRERYAADELGALLAGAADYLSQPPRAMVAEAEFHALVERLVARLGPERAGAILERSGERTADYVLGNRIPAPARAALRLLPAPLSLRLLLPAIARHAWTFAGSAGFSYRLGRAPWLSIGGPEPAHSPAIAAPLCRYYRGAFSQMLRRLVSPRLELRELACQARGDGACRYRIVT